MIFLTVVCVKNKALQRDLEVFFMYYAEQLTDQPVGYAKRTTLGRMSSGDVGEGVRGMSLVPAGVEMTDLYYLQMINRVGAGIAALHIHNERWWEFIAAKYGLGESVAELMARFGICKRSCMSWHADALKFLEGKC